jgi:hypothetical protein
MKEDKQTVTSGRCCKHFTLVNYSRNKIRCCAQQTNVRITAVKLSVAIRQSDFEMRFPLTTPPTMKTHSQI